MRTRREGPGVGKLQALGVRDPGTSTRGNPTLRPRPSAGCSGCSSGCSMNTAATGCSTRLAEPQ